MEFGARLFRIITVLLLLIILIGFLEQFTDTWISCLPSSVEDTCSAIFDRGTFEFDLHTSRQIFRPKGCRIRYRSLNETVHCMHGLAARWRRTPVVAFVGDSRIRQLRDEFIYQISGTDTDNIANKKLKVDQVWYGGQSPRTEVWPLAGVRVQFEWAPFIASGMDSIIRYVNRTLNGKSRPPDVLVIGAGVWKARLCVQMPKLWDSCLVKYKQAFKDLLPLLAELSATTDVIWLPIGSVNETTMLKRVNRVFNVSMTNVKLALLNEAVAEVMSSMPTGRVEYWYSSWLIGRKINDMPDGLHFGRESKYHSIQLLTNRMCNSLDHEFQERKSCLRFLEQFHFDDPYCCTAV